MGPMKFLYIGLNDIFSRHELGFIVALRSAGHRVDILRLGAEASKVEELLIGSDCGAFNFRFLNLATDKSIHNAIRYASILSEFINIGMYDMVFATPRLPILVASIIGKKANIKVILRLWSIRAAKLRDNLRFGARGDIFIFVPSIIMNSIYISSSDFSIAVDHATYSFAKRIYPFLDSRIIKLYPPWGYIKTDYNAKDEEVLKTLECLDEYILGFTSLHKTGAYLKFESIPHALVLYALARRLKNVNVVVAGSDSNEWKKVFPNLSIPKNMKFVGRGFTDNVLSKIYEKAMLVVMPITNRNVSNRLLDALFFGRPIITSEVVTLVHPELKHGLHIYISHWDKIVEETSNLAKNHKLLKNLEEGAKEAYSHLFSTKTNIATFRRII